MTWTGGCAPSGCSARALPILATTAPAWANLRGLLQWNADPMRRKRRLGNGFWMSAPDSAAVLYDWFSTEARAQDAVRALAQESSALYGTVRPGE